ncbi:MAG: energy transducer TonB [Treponema sp.]|nr:energy transducer TonB [Treponema sp.]
MLNEKYLKLLLFLTVAAIHLLLIFFLAFTMKVSSQAPSEHARMMRLTDFTEYIPAPPSPPPREAENIPEVESIAETMIEAAVVPEQRVVAAGTLITPGSGISWDDYLPIHRVSDPPQFDEREIAAALVYPPIALRSAIEGRVILELFVDKNGLVQQVRILQETPKDRGFGEAAVRAFTGRQGTPALADGEPVSSRYRYPVSFRIR